MSDLKRRINLFGPDPGASRRSTALFLAAVAVAAWSVASVQAASQPGRPPAVRPCARADRAAGPVAVRFTVTAYCGCTRCCGPRARGVTASGVRVRAGHVAAPRWIPFGTAMHIPGYGRAVVADRGGAIKGGRLDVYFPTHQAARRWGVRRLTVIVYPRGAEAQPSPLPAGHTLAGATPPARASRARPIAQPQKGFCHEPHSPNGF